VNTQLLVTSHSRTNPPLCCEAEWWSKLSHSKKQFILVEGYLYWVCPHCGKVWFVDEINQKKERDS
jgi:hypothetical protein